MLLWRFLPPRDRRYWTFAHIQLGCQANAK